MALTLAPAAAVKFVLVDETGSQGFCVFHLPSGTLIATAIGFVDTLAANIAALSGCMVLSYSISYSKEENAPGGPAAGARVEHKGRFIWQLANGLNSRTEIPGIDPAVVLTDGAIDMANSDVTNFVNDIVTGTVFCGADGSDVTAIDAAYEAFRRSTRRQLPTRRLT
jgi:hypothetical protein